MQIILLEKIHRRGDIGSIVDVKDGFGRNFLIPRKKAIRATKANIEYFEKQKEHIAKINKEKKTQAEELSGLLNELRIVIVRQSAEDGRLYGSVTAKDIVNAIHAKVGKDIATESVVLTDKFKEIGEYQISVALHPEVIVNLQLTITRTNSSSE
jgi:large subunit ribosomal protein L9